MAGCDYVESFHDVGQLSWLNLYVKDDGIAKVFSDLMTDPLRLQDKFNEIMKFVLTCYKVRNPSLGCEVGRVEKIKFNTIKTLRQLLPSKPALYLHNAHASCSLCGRFHLGTCPHS